MVIKIAKNAFVIGEAIGDMSRRINQFRENDNTKHICVGPDGNK